MVSGISNSFGAFGFDQTSFREQAPQAKTDAPTASGENRDPATGTEETTQKTTAFGSLTTEQRQIVTQLKAVDTEVRNHEQAHKSAGADLTGPAKYEYTRGPDGRRYATEGEVSIDVSREADPEATVRKMETVIRAALAPAEPSPQDRQVAAQARHILQEAQQESRTEREEASRSASGSETSGRAKKAYQAAAGMPADPEAPPDPDENDRSVSLTV